MALISSQRSLFNNSFIKKTFFLDSRPAYQILEDKPGYVGVYIRLGDQPLDEINFALAEAFREHDISARNIKPVSFR